MDGLSTLLSFRRRDPSLALVTDAVHRLDRQVFEITVTLRLHPRSGHYADSGPWRGAEQGLLLSHTIARLQYAPWRKGVPSA